MNKLLAVRKFDILIANGNNKLLFKAPVDTVPSNSSIPVVSGIVTGDAPVSD